MIPLRRKILILALRWFDMIVMISSFFLAALIVNVPHEHIAFADFLSMRIKLQNFLIFGGVVFIWYIVYTHSGVYAAGRLRTLRNLFTDIVKIASLSALTLLAMKFLFNIRMINWLYLGVFWVLVCTLMMLGRVAIRSFLKFLRMRGRNLRSILLIGINLRSLELLRKIAASPELGYRVIGFVDDRKSWLDTSTGLPVITFEGFQDFLKDNIVDEIMVCLPLKSLYAKANEVISACEEQGIIVRLMSDLFDLKLAKSQTTEFMDDTVTTLYTGEMIGNTMLLKRLLDIFVSLTLSIVLSPLLLLTAFLINLTSTGPVLFVQERIGLNKRRFGVYKFRTMYPDAEKRMAELEHLNEVSGPVFKIKNDPRITPFGRFLRKTSIDELPQLFNVLLGHMSMVGPRPLPVRDYNGFSQDWHRRRFSVKPGITCLWQISGRSNISFHQWMELDMEYIDHWSLWLDIKILLGTIPAVFKGSGAA
jgi:exopolysaccharide biosynthesis polyprenyl glycosylphosphotransferase